MKIFIASIIQMLPHGDGNVVLFGYDLGAAHDGDGRPLSIEAVREPCSAALVLLGMPVLLRHPHRRRRAQAQVARRPREQCS